MESALKGRTATGRKGMARAVACGGVVLFLFLLPLFGLSTYYIHILIGVFIWAIAASSLRLINLSGQGSIGHAAFMSIGAYTSGILAKYLEWSPWITMPLGAVATFVVAFLVGIPFTRVRGIYFTMMSLFFGIGVLAINQVFSPITGGYSGMGSIPLLFAYDKTPYYYFCLVLAIVMLAIMYRMEFSRIGLTWKAVAQSHGVASSIGIDEAGQRVLSLSIGCLFAGIAGAVYSHYYTIVTQETFSFNMSINLFVYMMVGGVSQFAGPIVGTAVLIIVPELFRNLKDYVPFIFAGILLIVLFAMPQGLAGLPDQLSSWYRRIREEKATASRGKVLNRAP